MHKLFIVLGLWIGGGLLMMILCMHKEAIKARCPWLKPLLVNVLVIFIWCLFVALCGGSGSEYD